jgi:hypothetical protein
VHDPRAARPATPFLVAHRAGNRLADLRRAEELGLRLVEADVRLYRGRLEVRHLKTLGPLPILWDRWRLANPFAPRLVLRDLLEALGPGTELMLDLKGRDRRLPGLVLHALGESARPVTICSRTWALLEPFRGRASTRIVHSVGSRRQLQALRQRFAGVRLQGISIHERLLCPETARELLGRAELVLTWPVATVEQARRLAGLGVHGLITEVPEALASGNAAAAAGRA